MKSQNFNPIRVLIVEDEGLIALDIENHLLELGYEPAGIAEAGEMAVRQALELQPDLVLMDIRLKGEMDGIEAASIITKHLDVPIIYLTAFADSETLNRATSTNPLGYVLKPFDRTDLRTAIEVSLHKHYFDQAVKQQKEWLNIVLESIGDAVISTDIYGTITFINRVASLVTQWGKAEALGKHVNDVIPLIDDRGETVENPLLLALKNNKGYNLPEGTFLVARNQREIPIEDSAVLILDDKMQVYGAVIVFRDITESYIAKQQLFRQAYYDSLTNLPNRSSFVDRLQYLIDFNKQYHDCKFAILFVDLDRFKNINDSLGHSVGDRLLVIVAQRLQQCLRGTDTIARFGGDEFSILLEQVADTDTACELAERINHELSIPCFVNDHELFNSASIGIVLSQFEYSSAEEMIRDADIAMYHAKANGRGCHVVFDSEMHIQAQRKLALETDLRRAIANQEITVHYQPIISLLDREIISFEALARWRHPEQGLIPPDIFIPIAEEIGLVAQLDQWILQQACHQIKAWRDRFPHRVDLGVSVNFSSYCFSRADVVDRVDRTLSEAGLTANNLKLEITERALLENPESAAQTLTDLKNMGIQIHIDDFGTGYSSLSYLHKYPIDAVKIDRSFIQNTDCDIDQLEAARKIIRTINILTKALNMTAIAEGVETAEQLESIQTLDCEYAQGYYFHQPLPHEAVIPLLTN